MHEEGQVGDGVEDGIIFPPSLYKLCTFTLHHAYSLSSLISLDVFSRIPLL